jgi:Uma2 family endonuclease
MPQIAPQTQSISEPGPRRVRWTREQAAAISEAGILEGRYELIDGEILQKMGQKPLHAYVTRLVTAWLSRIFGAEYVQCQLPIRVAHSDERYNEPEPDVAVTRQPNTAFANRHPAPDDLSLVVEVSDSTVNFDLTAKALLYARAGIAEYWVFDLIGRRIIVHREPQSEDYARIAAYAEDESVSTLELPDDLARAADLLPPLSENETGT